MIAVHDLEALLRTLPGEAVVPEKLVSDGWTLLPNGWQLRLFQHNEALTGKTLAWFSRKIPNPLNHNRLDLLEAYLLEWEGKLLIICLAAVSDATRRQVARHRSFTTVDEAVRDVAHWLQEAQDLFRSALPFTRCTVIGPDNRQWAGRIVIGPPGRHKVRVILDKPDEPVYKFPGVNLVVSLDQIRPLPDRRLLKGDDLLCRSRLSGVT